MLLLVIRITENREKEKFKTRNAFAQSHVWRFACGHFCFGLKCQIVTFLRVLFLLHSSACSIVYVFSSFICSRLVQRSQNDEINMYAKKV